MLQIGFNMLTELGKVDGSLPVATQKVNGFAKLEDLHLEGNLFSDWNQILRLSHLPRYEARHQAHQNHIAEKVITVCF